MNERTEYSESRIAFIDLDDTLLGPDKTVSRENQAALGRLHEAGVTVAFASGRHHDNMVAMEAVGRRGWVLSSNGSIVRHAPTDETLLELTIAPDLVGEICERARAEGTTVIAYHREGAFIEADTPWTEMYAAKAGWVPAKADFRSLPPGGFQKILWSGSPQWVRETFPSVAADYAGRLNVLVTNPELIEFFAPTANKAVGAQALASRLRIAPERAMAFGDGSNDVEILTWAGTSVAMSHGKEVARKAARFVSPEGSPESAFARAVDLALNA